VVATDMGMTPLAELAMGLRRLMLERGWTREDFAHITAKNRAHAALNPLAEIQQTITVEQVLAAREVAWPLTRPMCASAAVDGAVAVIVCTRATARQFTSAALPRIAAMALGSTPYASPAEALKRSGLPSMDAAPPIFARVYERAAVGPEDLELLQVHDAVAPEEMLAYSTLGLCAPGDEAALLHSGATRIGGRVPVQQMRGRAGAHQVIHTHGGPPRIAAIHNAGARGGAAGGVPICAGLIFKNDS
jgi:acetyl-CoA acetyltransferase